MKISHLEKITAFYKDYKRMPSYSEIMGITGLKSKNPVYKLVKSLVKTGWIEQDDTGRLIPKKMLGSIPLIGYVQAGWPSPAEEELKDTLNIDDYLIRNREATFLFKASGDSMIEAGIMPGDLLLVERGMEPKNGDIVVAEVDRKWTLKYFQKDKGKIWLEPANKKYRPIYPKEDLRIAAVVVGVIRKYRL